MTQTMDNKIDMVLERMEGSSSRKSPRITENMDCESNGNYRHLSYDQMQGNRGK